MTSWVNSLCISLIIIWSVASFLSVGAHGCEAAILILLHCTIMNHLINQILCCYCICIGCLHLLNFWLENIKLLNLCFYLLLLELSINLLISNLLLGFPSFAAWLEQIGGWTLASYCRRKVIRSLKTSLTYCSLLSTFWISPTSLGPFGFQDPFRPWPFSV